MLVAGTSMAIPHSHIRGTLCGTPNVRRRRGKPDALAPHVFRPQNNPLGQCTVAALHSVERPHSSVREMKEDADGQAQATARIT